MPGGTPPRRRTGALYEEIQLNKPEEGSQKGWTWTCNHCSRTFAWSNPGRVESHIACSGKQIAKCPKVDEDTAARFQGVVGGKKKREVEKDDADAVERQAQAAEDKRRKHEELVMHPVHRAGSEAAKAGTKTNRLGFPGKPRKISTRNFEKNPGVSVAGKKSPVFRVFRVPCSVFRVSCPRIPEHGACSGLPCFVRCRRHPGRNPLIDSQGTHLHATHHQNGLFELNTNPVCPHHVTRPRF